MASFFSEEKNMSELNFTEDDKKKTVEFLNMLSEHAEFKFNTNEVISYFKLLAHMQQKILPKIEANILEIKRVIESKDKATEPNKE